MTTRLMTTKLCLFDVSLVSHWFDSGSLCLEAATRDMILSTAGRKIFNLLKLRF